MATNVRGETLVARDHSRDGHVVVAEIRQIVNGALVGHIRAEFTPEGGIMMNSITIPLTREARSKEAFQLAMNVLLVEFGEED